MQKINCNVEYGACATGGSQPTHHEVNSMLDVKRLMEIEASAKKAVSESFERIFYHQKKKDKS